MLLDEFLRQRRDRCGVTHRQISRALLELGVPTHENAIGRWMNGTTRPSAARFDALLEVLEVTSADDVRQAYRMRWPVVANVLSPECSP
jgi:transcriptional regulator with XRE-family HTH domain